MDKFTCMQALVRVVESGSFAEAARRMGVSAPMVTKYISHLEQSLGSRLLNRSTHSLSLTDSGHAYYQRCVQLLEDLDEAEAIAGAQSSTPRGSLRMSVSTDFGVNHLGPVLLEYSREYPDVRIDVSVSNHLVDLIEEGFDLAVRITNQLRTNLVARKLATSNLVVCAAPAYLEAHGTPQIPENLVHHNCLAFSDPTLAGEWRLSKEGRVSVVKAAGSLRASSNELLKLAALQGQGVVLQPTFNVSDELRTGRLVPLLTDYDAGALGIFIVYPHRKHQTAKVRSFIDTLVGRWGENSDEDPFWKKQ
ncbi:DNA-binding transcriptional LysR family regulator [Povalibacter uvarum]|uniref:DNA-binding transcriptional LysR family regulator n=1 Tax=Povalibacter uvarum TaxID=732238 RepID=A0A841HJ70_9GAMM|nr:LysR family transcriptional regulator [Povalibacter uvarum]MBB6093261.1 DNA-binding transcriptional LysR family regulator [Povalibacter uvarum]